MYVSPISRRFWFGRLTPAMRAKVLSLPLLVPGVGADHHGAPVPLDHAAALTHRLDGRAYFHRDPSSGSVAAAQRWRNVIRPRVRSYGESSTLTLSPGRMRM